MKKFFLITILFILLSSFSNGQWYNKYYPNKQLSELTKEELSFLLNKSVQTKTNGTALIIIGIVPAIIGSVYLGIIGLVCLTQYILNEATGEIGDGISSHDLILPGVLEISGITLCSLGMYKLKTGKMHILEINKQLDKLKPEISFKIVPVLQINNFKKIFSVGVSATLSF